MSHKVTDPVEPVVICNQLIRDAIVVPDDEGAVDPGKAQEEIEWHEITCLRFSYKGACEQLRPFCRTPSLLPSPLHQTENSSHQPYPVPTLVAPRPAPRLPGRVCGRATGWESKHGSLRDSVVIVRVDREPLD
jgi:hypothetical protein